MPFPRTESLIDSLLQIWAIKALGLKTQFGLSDAQITQISDDSIVYSYLRLVRQLLDDELAEFSAFKQKMMAGEQTDETPSLPEIVIPPMPATAKPPKPGIENAIRRCITISKIIRTAPMKHSPNSVFWTPRALPFRCRT